MQRDWRFVKRIRKDAFSRTVYAIGTWMNPYGHGRQPPLDRVDRRGEMVPGTGKKHGE